MKCLRCNEEMKHYSIGTCISVFGAEKKHLGNIVQEEHSPRSVYMCEKCGYMELSRDECNKTDV